MGDKHLELNRITGKDLIVGMTTNLKGAKQDK